MVPHPEVLDKMASKFPLRYSSYQMLIFLIKSWWALSFFPKKTLKEKEIYSPRGKKKIARVALLTGCVQKEISPQINEATIRILNRHRVEVVIPKKNKMLWLFIPSFG